MSYPEFVLFVLIFIGLGMPIYFIYEAHKSKATEKWKWYYYDKLEEIPNHTVIDYHGITMWKVSTDFGYYYSHPRAVFEYKTEGQGIQQKAFTLSEITPFLPTDIGGTNE